MTWLAGGGLAEVFEAEDPWTGDPVVIKRMRPRWRDDRRADAHFVVEACALRRLVHAPVAHLRGEGLTDARLRYLVLDRADGVPFDAWLGRGPDLRSALSTFVRVVDVVARVHAEGVLHGDLKPGNVMIGGDVVLIDFGLAVVAGLPAARPRGFGTPEYVAPELVADAPRAVATEVYALGAMLYELIAGAPPFTGEPEAIAHGHVYEPIVPPSLRSAAPIAPALDAVVMRALARRPDERFESIAALRHALVATRPSWATTPARSIHPRWDHLATLPAHPEVAA